MGLKPAPINTGHAKLYSEPWPEVWLLLWHAAPFWGCMQVEKPCLPNVPDALASQCSKFRAWFAFITCPTYYVLTGQPEDPEVRINVIYAHALWPLYRARLKENELHKLYSKEQLDLTYLTPPAGTVPEGAPQCLNKGEEKAISTTETKQSP